MFRSKLSEDIFINKYKHQGCETWDDLCRTLVEEVVRDRISKEDRDDLIQYMREGKFFPGGRYLYYAGRPVKFYNNCYLLRSLEDSREDWADLSWKAESCLLTGGGIGNDYSIYRDSKQTIRRTGGRASGPLPKMYMVNELGRNVMQGGSRRSAIYASLNWKHGDIYEFLRAKDWHNMKVPGTDKTLWDIKQEDFNFPAPLDMTNISVNYDTEWIENYFKTGEYGDVFLKNVEQALRTGEPGFSFNFWDKENETLRNAPVSKRTRVLTKDGYKSVEEIIGIETTLWSGKQWTKGTFSKTYENVPTVRVTLSNGRSIVCDPSHPFIVWTKKGNIRVNAIDLKSGTSIVSSLPAVSETVVGEEYGYGFVYGDGSIRNGRGEISIHTESKQPCYDKTCLELNARVHGDRAYFNTTYNTKEFIPSASFVAGWFDADGNFGSSLRLSNKDKKSLLELSEYLDTLGILSSIREEKLSGYGSVTYSLIVPKNSWKMFASLIPTLRVKPSVVDSYRIHNIKVVKVEETGELEDVYCCEVDVEEHSFMAEGVVISNCTEVTSEDDSDVCNLASINLARVEDIEEFSHIVELGTVFLLCGTIEAMLPYEKVYKVREKNRRLGLGLMGVHEWLIRRGSKYEVTPELHQWLSVYRGVSNDTARKASEVLGISTPKACRAIAPTGTISMLAGTTSGIEPLYAVAYKRRYLVNGNKWRYQYAVDNIAHDLINEGDIDPSSIESAIDLAVDYERRIKFQADVQDYVDMSISSTINLPSYESQSFSATEFADTLARYAPRLRGFTCYPDGARGGQPLTRVDYVDAVEKLGEEFDEHVEVNDVCSITNRGGSCGS